MQDEGWIDPYALLMALKNKAMSSGARFIDAEMIKCVFTVVPNVVVPDTDGDRPFEECRSVIVSFHARFFNMSAFRASYDPFECYQYYVNQQQRQFLKWSGGQ